MLGRKMVLMVAVGLLLVGCGESSDAYAPTSTTAGEHLEEASDLLKADYQRWLDAINQARAEVRDCHDGKGLVGPSQPLRWNDELYASAYEHSYDMAMSDTFSHYGSGTKYDITADGGSPSYFYERIENNGYTHYQHLGENIAGGQESIEEVMNAWLESPGHCANIMNNDFDEIGMAIVMEEESRFGIYWTQNFGG